MKNDKEVFLRTCAVTLAVGAGFGWAFGSTLWGVFLSILAIVGMLTFWGDKR